MPEPIIAPIPSAVNDHGPSVFCRRCPGDSASAISLSMDLQQSSWLSEVRMTSLEGGSVVIGSDKGWSLLDGSTNNRQQAPGNFDRWKFEFQPIKMPGAGLPDSCR